MSSSRIYDLARKLNVPSRELIKILKNHGIEVKSHMSTVDEKTANLIVDTLEKKKSGEVANKKEGAVSSEKKGGARMYIPPRQRQRKRPIRGGAAHKFHSPAQQEAEKPSTKPQGPSGHERQQVPSSRGAAAETQRVSRRPGSPKEEHPREKAAVDARKRHTQGGRKPLDRQARSPQAAGHERPDTHGKRHDRSPVRRKPTPGRTQEQASASHVKRKKDGTVTEEQRQGTAKAGNARFKKPVTAKHDRGNAGGAKRQTEGSRSPQKPKGRPGRRDKTKRTSQQNHSAKQALNHAPAPEVEQAPKRLEIPEVIMVKELAEKMQVPPAKIIQHLITMGIMANVNQVLETKAAMSIAEELGFEVVAVAVEDEAEPQDEAIDEAKLKPRPPVVTIMGHVDHGKTTLLDAIRESKIVDSEFGGITQHIGAYSVDINGQRIVFLDTPGHEAFTAMRARGAKVTDEVILVVAADDGVMPQTIEAIDHARAAEVPIVVAINKTDVPGANPDRVLQELSKYGLNPEEWGGDTICVRVSAKERSNLDELLEMMLLQAEMLELKADPDRSARGVIVEALLDKGRGPVATVLIQSGTLRIGDPFVVGMHHGKVRALLDDRGKRIKSVGPATPVEVLGLTGVPVAGDLFVVVGSDREARLISESRQSQQQKAEFLKTGKITLEELHHHIKEGETQELRIVIKADVHGSVEALGDALERLSTEKVRLQVIHGGVGAINESDVMLASASNAIVLGFNVSPVAKAREMAEKEQIDVRLYTVIYQAIDDIRKAMEGLLKPVFNEVLIGQAQVLALFSLPKGGVVAGCRVTNGKVTRNCVARLVRDRQELFKGNLASLRRVKDDVREVLTGYECGIRLENFNDVKVNDIIEAYTLEKMTVSLDGTIAKK